MQLQVSNVAKDSGPAGADIGVSLLVPPGTDKQLAAPFAAKFMQPAPVVAASGSFQRI